MSTSCEGGQIWSKKPISESIKPGCLIRVGTDERRVASAWKKGHPNFTSVGSSQLNEPNAYSIAGKRRIGAEERAIFTHGKVDPWVKEGQSNAGQFTISRLGGIVLRAGRIDTLAPLRKVAFLGNYIPRQCGLATFTADLRGAIAARYPSLQCPVVAVNDRPLGYDYPPEVRFEIFEPDLSAYRRAADFLNLFTADVLCLQHEFGIFGGPEGSHVLALLRAATMPIVTTLHTILQNPTLAQRRVFLEVVRLSQRLVVMSKKAADFLREIYHVSEAKIDIIPHGIPDVPFVDPSLYKDQFGVGGKQVVFTFGLLSPNKGIENVLNALPQVIAKFPNVVYIILGATHPNLVRDHGEAYRLSLERLARKNGIESHVIFFNQFVELEELTKFIGAADIYITPYLKQEQITSGALAYGFGSGKAVVSTPYWHAAELLADDRGILVPFSDPGAIARAIDDLLSDENRRQTMRKNAYRIGRKMVWSNVAQMYVRSFERARRKQCESPRATSDSHAGPAPEDFAAPDGLITISGP